MSTINATAGSLDCLITINTMTPASPTHQCFLMHGLLDPCMALQTLTCIIVSRKNATPLRRRLRVLQFQQQYATTLSTMSPAWDTCGGGAFDMNVQTLAPTLQH